jgi:hypothetical protein
MMTGDAVVRWHCQSAGNVRVVVACRPKTGGDHVPNVAVLHATAYLMGSWTDHRDASQAARDATTSD